MKRIFITVVGALLMATLRTNAGNGQVQVTVAGTNAYLQVEGKASDEWRFQTSEDLLTWSDAPELGAVFSAKTNPAPISAGIPTNTTRFYRAVQTEGLFDPLVLRTISLTFTQSNWQTLMKNYKTSGSNLLGNLELSGTVYPGVGVRYRGNSSYSASNAKNSVNIELNYTNAEARLMGFKSVNLNNANGDESLIREALYFNLMRQYTICPHASLVKLNINDAYWGVYSFVQQEDGDLIKEWCASNDGDRWRAPNVATGTGTGGGGGGPGGGGGGGGGGGSFSSGTSALTYLGTSEATYQSNYELKSDNSTNPWPHLINVTYVLNNTATDLLRDQAENVLAVDRWLWFLAIENIFTDEDGYYYKGADYTMYYEPESGRLHPVEHDGNETSVTGSTSLSPVEGTSNANRPVISNLLAIPELRQRYLAHLRTVLAESFNLAALSPVIEQYRALSVAAIASDTKKSFTMTTYSNELTSLKSFIQKRYSYLTNHAELTPIPPTIMAVSAAAPAPTEAANILAQVQAYGTEGIASVWLYYRDKTYGRFTRSQMYDDGAHGDGAVGDGVYGGYTTNFAAGKKIHYYVEARSGNTAQAAAFSPARAEESTYQYRVALTLASNTPVVINELLAVNDTTLADPQGKYDDWIELRNRTSETVDLTGRYLTDDPEEPRKWAFPEGTTLPADGYLLVWADNDEKDTPGLHAGFKLPASGGQVFLVDTDANLNLALDAVTFGAQTADRAYGRTAADPDAWSVLDPTPGAANP